MNEQQFILIADGTRARFLFVESGDNWNPEKLVEYADLVNPGHQQAPHKRMSGARSESRGRVLGHWYGMDDHRNAHETQLEKSFAARIVAESVRLIEAHPCFQLTILAAPKMLGFIRQGIARIFHKLEILAWAKNVTRFTLPELQLYFKSQDLLLPLHRSAAN